MIDETQQRRKNWVSSSNFLRGMRWAHSPVRFRFSKGNACVCVWSRKNDTRAELVETSTSQEGVKFGELTHYRKNISLFRKYFRKSRACVNPSDTRTAAPFFPPRTKKCHHFFAFGKGIWRGKNPPVTHVVICLGKNPTKVQVRDWHCAEKNASKIVLILNKSFVSTMSSYLKCIRL